MAGIQITLAPFIPTHSIVHLSMRRVCSVDVESPGIGNGFPLSASFQIHPPSRACLGPSAWDSGRFVMAPLNGARSSIHIYFFFFGTFKEKCTKILPVLLKFHKFYYVMQTARTFSQIVCQ